MADNGIKTGTSHFTQRDDPGQPSNAPSRFPTMNAMMVEAVSRPIVHGSRWTIRRPISAGK